MLRGDDLAYAVLDYIREHPQEWDQRTYICDTTACFAGRAILLAYGEEWESRGMREFPGTTRVTDDFFYSAPEGGGISQGMLARELLGWNREQADAVFRCYTNDFSVLETQVKRVLNGEVLYAASSQGTCPQVRMAGDHPCLHPGGTALPGGDHRSDVPKRLCSGS